nr:hypothetical protein [uncultured Methanosphaera sp.]
MTNDNKSLGRGLEALIKKSEDKDLPENAAPKKREKRHLQPQITPNKGFGLTDEKVDEIKEDAQKNPRITLWSVKSAACFRYLKKTVPEFSISNEAAEIIDQAMQEKYPEIWELFDDEE